MSLFSKDMAKLEAQQFIECAVAVSDAAMLTVGGQTFIAAGFNDGALCLLDMSARKG